MKKLFLPGLSCLLVLSLILCACESFNDDKDFTGDGPEIEWISGGTTISFIYSQGVVSSYNFKRSFKVIKDTGEVVIKLSKTGNSDNMTMGTFNVEQGKEYNISVIAGISGMRTVSGSENCFSVSFRSPNCREDYEIQVPSFYVQSYNEWVPDMNYCPESFSFGEVIISE